MRGGSGGERGGALTRNAPLEGFGSGRAFIPSEALHETDRYTVEVLAAGLLRPQALIDLFRPLRRSGRPHPIIQTEPNWKSRDEKEQHEPPPASSSGSHAPDVRAVAAGVNPIGKGSLVGGCGSPEASMARESDASDSALIDSREAALQVLAESLSAPERLRHQLLPFQEGIAVWMGSARSSRGPGEVVDRL